MELHQAIDEFLLAVRVQFSPETERLYSYTLKKLVEELGREYPLDELTIRDLREWQAGIDPELSVFTLHRDVRQAKKFFAWLVDEGHLPHSPAERLKLPKLPNLPPRAISDHDIGRLLSQADNLQDYTMIRFLAESGCRVGGVAGLLAGDLDLEVGEAVVTEKGRKTRVVMFGQPTAGCFARLKQDRDWVGTDCIFVGRRGPLTGSGIWRRLQSLAALAGVKERFNPHSFRHALARRLLRNGADLGTVSQILGHSSVEITHKFYARWTSGELASRWAEYGGELPFANGLV